MPALLYRIDDDDDHLILTLLSTKRGTRSPVHTHSLSPCTIATHAMLYTHTPAIPPTIHTYRPSTHQHTPRLSALKLQPTTCNAQSYPLRSCPPPHTYTYILEGTHITQTHKHKAQMTKPPESTPKRPSISIRVRKLRGCRWLGVQRKVQSKLSNVSEA